jgi:hypothetical protein
MAIEKADRKNIEKLVVGCRKLLETEFGAQFQMLYGIGLDGIVADIATLGHLSDTELRTARALRDELSHLAAGAYDKKALIQATERLLHELSFTTLNRFAALKMCEQRDFLVQSIGAGYSSKGFELYGRLAGPALGDSFERYSCFLSSMFDELSMDLGVLFDRHAPGALLFPRENALLDLLGLLNDGSLASLWAEDETIGWMYQYFNTKEERRAMREDSGGAPRNSRELAVRNQFFTPRYVVRFLVENSLGRQWYEMTRGKTSLVSTCEFLVRKPKSIFLSQGESAPAALDDATDYVAHRPHKDPREIRILDPACGSMHFGLYAFDLLEVIYREAWDNHPELLADLCEKGMSREEFLERVPALIIERNIHGIDIDLRCAQIAALSLWLRAQKSWKEAGITAAKRPSISRSNIACAEPMPGENALLEEYTSGLKPAVLGGLVASIWKEMRLAGEAGSLLRIEERIEEEVHKAKTAWKVWTIDMGREHHTQIDMFRRDRQLNLKDLLGYDVSDIEEASEWVDMEGRLLQALNEFEEKTNAEGMGGKRLFAEDAAAGFSFIDICRKRYDVVVMNPPFGESAAGAKEYIAQKYPRTKNDLAAAFIEMGLRRLEKGGLLGAITTRTIFFLSSHTKFREEIMLKEARPVVFADLGFGVLDAMVETAAYVVEKA